MWPSHLVFSPFVVIIIDGEGIGVIIVTAGTVPVE